MKTIHVNKFIEISEIVTSNTMVFFNVGVIFLSVVIAVFVLKNT